MAWSNPGPDGTPSFLSCSHPAPLRTLQAISSYFEAEMRRGRLAEHDPEIAARAFVGSVHNYVILDLLFGAHNEQRIPEESFLRRLVDLLWSGLDPTNGESPQSSGGRP
jgi:hypothetical protein